MHVLTPLGQTILAMPEDQAVARLRELDRGVRSNRSRQSPATSSSRTEAGEYAGPEAEFAPATTGGPGQEVAPDDGDEEADKWENTLLGRLHQMTPTAFERFALDLLRSFDLELEHTGGTGDEGIDGIGIAPISPVLSAKVAVQVKRYNPKSSAGIGRKEVALFQRDAEVAGAERAIMVTLGRYTSAARDAAAATTPMVDLIDGKKLCDLVRDREIGIRIVPQVVSEFFDRFESAG